MMNGSWGAGASHQHALSGILAKSFDRRHYGHQATHWRSKKRASKTKRGKKQKKPIIWAGPEFSAGEATELTRDGKRGQTTLTELTTKTCHWPYDGGLFCGAEAVPEYPYCHNHCRRAYLDFHPGRSRTTEC